MKILLGLFLFTIYIVWCRAFYTDGKITPLNATAIVRGKPLRRFFDRWNPKGLQPFTEFVYTVKTDFDKILEIHCPYISLHQPCEEYFFKIIDGSYNEKICGKVKKYYYTSKTNKVDIMIRTGKKLVKVAPRCTARQMRKK